jgi:hypothetical protein
VALNRGLDEIAKLLLEVKGVNVNLVDEVSSVDRAAILVTCGQDGDKPLDIACVGNMPSTVSLLLAKGANPNLPDMVPSYGVIRPVVTPLPSGGEDGAAKAV